MQFHLSGFRSGDPNVSDPVEARVSPDEVDVLIVGCGPTGLTLAAQLAAFPDIHTRIIDQKSGPLQIGQADGVACRSMEMYEAFGFAERVLKEAYWVNETSFWKPDETDRTRIVRGGRIQDTEDDLSEFPHVILNQARIHDFLLETMRNAPARLEPAYNRRLMELVVDESASRPVSVRIARLDAGREGEAESVKARYVVGCDGARSAVRAAIGQELRGDSANQAWGVMDVLAVTDFPDIRLKAAIHSANEGSVLIIPREGGYLVRLYIELDQLRDDERIASRNITVDDLIAAARRILHPHVLDVKEVAWWSVYEIGQRLSARFDDARAVPRVFIAGDACHTHSPKAGQGMNVSVADGFNLGWKLAAVLRGRASPALLRTYSDERRALAHELIDFDRAFAEMFSAPPKDPTNPASEGVDPAEFQDYFVKQGRFTAGVAVRYARSMTVGEANHQHLAEGLVVGMRFHSAPVIRLADARPVQLGHTVKADGRWRLFIFAPAEESVSRVGGLCAFLADSPRSPIRKHTPAGADVDEVIDVRAVFQQGHRTLAVEAMPALLRPAKGRYGLRDYEKLFCADLRGGRDIFDMRRIDRAKGCVVLVRPDQFVAEVLPIGAHQEIAGFFDRFMLEAERSAHVEPT
jgi:phenol 2-monooxygenase (NADPH)